MPIVESLSSKGAVKQYTNQDIPSTGFIGNGANWVAREVPLSLSQNLISVTFPAPQLDTSYVVFAMMENLVDANPQIQQVEITNKTTSGFVAQWNMPLDSGNYTLTYILPSKEFAASETAIAINSTSLVDPFALFRASAVYPVIAVMQNLVDTNPQFQTILVTNKTVTDATLSWSHPTDTANYQAVALFQGTVQQAINSGVSSAVVTLPVSYGTSANYGIIVSMTNLVDPFPKFQPMIVTAKNPNSFTLNWPENTETANYQLTCYTVSLTN